MNAVIDKGRLFTRDFALISLVTFAIFAVYFSLYVTLPVYVESIGGSSRDIGLVIGIFMVSSILVKPLAGWGVDRYGRKGIMIAGLLIILMAVFLYSYSSSMILLLMLVVLHGTGWGISTTAATTLAADIAPAHRRGEALGYFGMFSNVAMAVGPATSMLFFDNRSFGLIFLIWAAVSLLSLFIAASIHETVPPDKEKPGMPLYQESRHLFDMTVLLAPAFIMFLINVSHSSIMSYLPLFALKQGLANPGFLYTVHAAGLLAVRPFAGKLSDASGRAYVIVPGIALLMLSQWILAAAPSLEMSLLVAVLYGIGFGAIYTSLIALMIDRATRHARGKAMGIFTASFDSGLGIGSILWGIMLMSNEFTDIYAAAGLVAFLALVSFYYLVQKESNRKILP